MKTLSKENVIENIDINKLNIEDIKVSDFDIERESAILNSELPMEKQHIILKSVVSVLIKFLTVPQ